MYRMLEGLWFRDRCPQDVLKDTQMQRGVLQTLFIGYTAQQIDRECVMCVPVLMDVSDRPTGRKQGLNTE